MSTSPAKQQIEPKALFAGGVRQGTAVAAAPRTDGDGAEESGQQGAALRGYTPLPPIEWPPRAKPPEVEEKACYTCSTSFSSLSSWRHECTECFHSFCATHCKDLWNDSDPLWQDGGKTPPSSVRVMCVECYCSRRLGHMEQALFAALDEVSLAGAMPLRFASSPPPFASSEDSPWLGNQIVPLRSEGGTPAAGASPSPSSASETSMLNMASGVVSSVFTSPTYVGRTFYSGIMGAARMASMTSPSSPAAASPSPSHLSQPSPTASTPPYHGHGHGQPAASRPTGVLGNIGASPGTSSSSPHTESTPQTAAQRAAMAALVGRIRGMEAECVALSKRLAGAEALRTRASLRIVHPQEGDVWYAGQACSITWVSHGAVRNLSVRIGSYVGSYVSSWQVIRDDIADTGNVTLALPHDTPTGWYCLRLSGSQGVVDAMSPYILIQGSLPPIMLTISAWVGDQRSTSSVVQRGGKCVIEWRKPTAGEEEQRGAGRAFDGDSSEDEESAGEGLKIQRDKGASSLREMKQSDGSNDPGPVRGSESFVRSESEDEGDGDEGVELPGIQGGKGTEADGGSRRGGDGQGCGGGGVVDGRGGGGGGGGGSEEGSGCGDGDGLGVQGVTLVHTTCKQAVSAVSGGGVAGSRESVDKVRRMAIERELAMMSLAVPSAKHAREANKDLNAPLREQQQQQQQQQQQSVPGASADINYVIEESSRYGYWKEVAKGVRGEGSYEWQVPRGHHQGFHLVRVRNMTATVVSGTVPVTVRDSIRFTSPSKGGGLGQCGTNVWQTGQRRRIAWDAGICVGPIKVSVGSQNGSWTAIRDEGEDEQEEREKRPGGEACGLEQGNEFVWRIPLDFAPGWYCFRAVNKVGNVTGVSDWTRIECSIPEDDDEEEEVEEKEEEE